MKPVKQIPKKWWASSVLGGWAVVSHYDFHLHRLLLYLDSLLSVAWTGDDCRIHSLSGAGKVPLSLFSNLPTGYDLNRVILNKVTLISPLAKTRL